MINDDVIGSGVPINRNNRLSVENINQSNHQLHFSIQRKILNKFIMTKTLIFSVLKVPYVTCQLQAYFISRMVSIKFFYQTLFRVFSQ